VCGGDLTQYLVQRPESAQEFADDCVRLRRAREGARGVRERAQCLPCFLGIGERIVERRHAVPPVVVKERCAWRTRECQSAKACSCQSKSRVPSFRSRNGWLLR